MKRTMLYFLELNKFGIKEFYHTTSIKKIHAKIVSYLEMHEPQFTLKQIKTDKTLTIKLNEISINQEINYVYGGAKIRILKSDQLKY